MTQFQEKKFNIPALKGISSKTIEEHLKLYSGYVKNTNLILSMIDMHGKVDDEGGKYSVSEVTRRFAFEFNGMKNHEIYFSHFENGPSPLQDGELKSAIEKTWGSFENFLTRFKTIALTRGIGWVVLSYDKQSGNLLAHWIDEQHLGQLNSTITILALDMWEHSFVADYQPSGKKQYIDDFFTNLNWQSCENNLKNSL